MAAEAVHLPGVREARHRPEEHEGVSELPPRVGSAEVSGEEWEAMTGLMKQAEDEAIRKNNCENCEKLLRARGQPMGLDAERIYSDVLADTPFPVIEQLVEAYRHIEEQEATIVRITGGTESASGAVHRTGSFPI
jgi:hypothetical protein